VLSEGERERDGGGEGDDGDGDDARCGRALRARAVHFDERGRSRGAALPGDEEARGRVWSEGEREGAGEGEEGDGGRRASMARAARMESANERGARTASASTSANASGRELAARKREGEWGLRVERARGRRRGR